MICSILLKNIRYLCLAARGDGSAARFSRGGTDLAAGARLALLLLVILYRKERWIMNNLDQAVERISSFL